jgi:hypothetical protein
MRLSDLKKFDLIYVGTPYSKWADGLDAAFVEAAKLTARLMQSGLKVYSPIAHTHPLAIYGNIDPLDHDIWLPFDGAMMDKADAMIVAMMDGWETSKGVRHEIQVFTEAGKPVFFMSPDDLSFAPGAA